MITSKIIANGLLRALGILVLIGLGLYFLYTIQTVLIYLIGALVFSLICNPIVELLKKIKFSNFWAVVITLLFFVFLLILFSLLFVPLISTQVQSLSLLNRDEIQHNFSVIYSDFILYLNQHDLALESVFKELDVASSLNFNFIPSILNHFFSTLSSIGIGIATVFFITFFILKDKTVFWKSFKKIIPDKFEDEILNSIQKIYNLLSRYFIGLLLQLFIVFILYYIVLAVFDVKKLVGLDQTFKQKFYPQQFMF
jgi:predicted PurR-regulated permease PerM